ncbi:MAG: hypothetical protein ABIT83_05140 [Massilia sp.]
MRGPQKMRFQLTAVGLACAVLVAGCGGGSNEGADGGIAQSVSFLFPGGEMVAAPPNIATVALKATASSGGPITYVSNTPTVCTVSGSTASLLKAGQCSINANQAGGDGFAPASARQIFVIPRQPSQVLFMNPGSQPLDAQPLTLEVSSSVASIAPVLTSSTPTVCTVSGTTLTKRADGLCTLTATVDGGDIYETSKVETTIPIGSAKAPEITFLSGYKPDSLTFDRNYFAQTNEGGRVVSNGGSSETDWWCDGRCATSISADGSSLSDTYTWDKPLPHTDGAWWRVWTEMDVYAPKVSFLVDGIQDGGTRIGAQKALNFTLSENQEWFDAGDRNVEIDLFLGHYVKKANGDNCHVKLRTNLLPTSPAATKYSLNLKEFSVEEKCELTDLDVWKELQTYPIVFIRFAPGAGNRSVQSTTAAAPSYPTKFTLSGPITFQ